MSTTQFSRSIKIINNSLQIVFEKNWYQEDISDLSDAIFAQLEQSQIIERVCGADKEYFRFSWNHYTLVLHFECYSRSCWIENEATLDQDSLKLLRLALIK